MGWQLGKNDGTGPHGTEPSPLKMTDSRDEGDIPSLLENHGTNESHLIPPGL